MTSMKWNNREITNPIARALLGTCAIFAGSLILAVATIAIVFGILITIPFDPILRMLGRRGFIRQRGASVDYIVDGSSFKRRR